MAFGDLTRIGANFNGMESLTQLNRVNGELSLVQSKLATGKRINTAEDDTAGYTIAKRLESRTRGLSSALSNVSGAKNILNVIEGGYQNQMSLLQTMKEKATQAADGSLSTVQRNAISEQVGAMVSELDDIATTTMFNEKRLIESGSSQIIFHVGEKKDDNLVVNLSGSNSADLSINAMDLTTQFGSSTAIESLETAIKTLGTFAQAVGDYQSRLTSKEESLSTAITNTESTRSRIEDADYAGEQMQMMKLQILQQTAVSSYGQSNSAPQLVMSLFR